MKVLKELENDDYTSTELAEQLGEKFDSVNKACKRLAEKEKLDKLENGKWQLRMN